MIKKSSTFALLAVVTTAWVLAVVSVAAQASTAGRPDLSGQWQLNHDLSDDAQSKFGSMQSASGGGARGGGHHGGGGGGEAGGGGHHGGSGGQRDKDMDDVRDLLLNAPTNFVLTQDDQKVVLAEPDGRVRTLLTNNHKEKVDGRNVLTRWDLGHLVSETTVGKVKLIETYERSPNGPQLIVTDRIYAYGEQMSLRRVYDAVKE